MSRKAGGSFYTILKWVCAAAVLVLVIGMNASGRKSSTDFSVMSEAVLAEADTEPMLEGDRQMIKRLYGLDPSDYEGVMLYYPSTNMGAEELLLVCLKDLSQQETVKAAIERRLEEQESNFEGYGIEQEAMLEKSITEVSGNYILFISAEDPGRVRDAFRKNL